MLETIINAAVEIAATLLITLVGVLGAWLTLKIGERAELKNIGEAQREVVRLAKLTVGELQQTVVDGLKEASADGRLTQAEIAMLQTELIDKTRAKLSEPARRLLAGAAVDLSALIASAGESWINRLKNA